ncbi:MAG: hypothetical protein KDD53_13000, partial [Bdellovibrionales bacterium]|nr:hypothetical protein [Bdellovibrionales bacterium]
MKTGIGTYSWIRMNGVLMILFILSFLLPISIFVNWDSVSAWFQSSDTDDRRFSEAFLVPGKGVHFALEDSNLLNPEEGKGFFMAVWFKIKELPLPGEEIQLVAKYDLYHVSKSGYSLALRRDGDVIYPRVYWRGRNAAGGWYQFSELKDILHAGWVLLAVSVYDGKLGLHTAYLNSGKDPKPLLLGGHEIGSDQLASSGVRLRVGAVAAPYFHGKIGA